MRRLRTTLLLGLILCAANCSAGEAASPWRSWNTLQLKTSSGVLFSGTAEFRMDSTADRPQLETQARARFLGATVARSRTTTTFDAGGRTLEHVRISKKKGRRFRFGEQSYSVEKFKSPAGPDGDESHWEVTSHREFDNPTSPAVLDDYYGMLLVRLRSERLNDLGDSVTVHVATTAGPQSYHISVGEKRRAEREFTDLTTGRETTLAIEEMRLLIRAADPDAAGGGFMNMEGDVEVWVEAKSKTLLEISGKVPKAGHVVLALAGMG